MLTQIDLHNIQKLFHQEIGTTVQNELKVQLGPAIKEELGHQLKPTLMTELKPFIRDEMRKALRFYPTRVEMNKKFDGITRKLNKIIGFFDREHQSLSHRVDRLEHHVGIN